MLSALQGEVKEAIDTEDHRFKPVVTNHKLAEYLEEEVRSRAAAIGEDMEPDLLTGIRPPHNFYRRLKEPIPDVIASSQDRQLAAAIRMAIHDSRSNEQLTAVQKGRKQTLLRLKDSITWKNIRSSILRVMSDHNDYLHFSTISDFRPDSIAVPRSAAVEAVEVVHRGLTFYEISAINCYDSPILIRQDEQWILIPNYPNVVTVVSRNLPGDILFFKSGRSNEQNELWDTYLSDFSSLVGSVPLRAADAQKFADNIRIGKEEYPHQAVTAGYLYEFSNDYDNIARTAHYMAGNPGAVPFDLALLCADKIWWSQEENGRYVAFADLPAVEPSQTDNQEYRPYYARREFRERENVRLRGIVPIFRQGWSFMQTELYLEIPETIRLIGENMNGRSAASLTDKGLRIFLEAFGYRVVETDS